jgi:hypothetical protein
MKQLLFILSFLSLSLVVKAQPNSFINASDCDLQFRQVCFDIGASPTCTVVSLGTTWTSAPAMGAPVTLPTNTCVAPYERGWQVRYAPSTGCTGSTTIKSVPVYCSSYPAFNPLPYCSCNFDPNHPPVVQTDGDRVMVTR